MITPAVWKSQFQATTTTAGSQSYGQVAAAPDGTFYDIWQDGSSGTAILVGRHFGANAMPLAGEVILYNYAVTSYSSAVVTSGERPRVAFQTNLDDSILYSFNASLDMTAYSPIETVGTPSSHPSVTALADGSLFVTYTYQNSTTDYDIIGQRTDADGNLRGSFVMISDDSDRSDFSRLATLDNGNFVVVYQSEYFGQSYSHDILFRIRSPVGSAIHSGYVAGNATNNTEADVAALHTGGFVVVWTRGTGASADIKAIIYDKDGTPVRTDGGEGILVNTTTTGQQGEAHVASMDDGGFLVTWEDYAAGNQKAQRFDSSGNRIGQEIVTHTGDVLHSSVATLADGRTVMSFDDFSSGNYNVYNAIYDTRTNVTGDVTGHDLFGDGTADQLILSTAQGAPGSIARGVITMFALDPGGALTQIGQVGADWSVAGGGDLNGDGRSDIIMQHDVGNSRELYAFVMGATQVAATPKLGAVGLDWQVDGTGDFNGDGFRDILLERLINGTKELVTLGVTSGSVSSIATSGVLHPDFQVDGIADMNGDGIADILVHSDSNGLRTFVELDQGSYTTQAVKTVATIGIEWNAVGMGDFNGDGRADILITTDTATARDIGILINQGGSFVFKDLGPLVGKNVQIDGIGDMNGDGTADISFHYDPTGTARTNAYFEMHDAAVTAIHTIGSTGHEWIVT